MPIGMVKRVLNAGGEIRFVSLLHVGIVATGIKIKAGGLAFVNSRLIIIVCTVMLGT